MLSLMLANGASAIACGELAGWYRVARYRNNARLPEFWRFLEEVEEQNCHSAIFKYLNVDVIIDSSKSIDWIIDTVKYGKVNNFKIVNLLIFKHPIDQVYSAWKRNQSVYASLFRYVLYHARMIYWSGLDFVTVDYDVLVSNPAKYLKNICDFVRIPYFAGKEKFWRGNYPPILGSNENVKRQLMRKASSIKKEAYNEKFLPVKKKMENIKLIHNVYAELKNRELCVNNELKNFHCYRTNLLIESELFFRKHIFLPVYRMYLARKSK